MWSCLDCAAPPLALCDGFVGLGGGATEACDEVDEVESLALKGLGGGPPTSGPFDPWPSSERKASAAGDNPIEFEAFALEMALSTHDDVLVVALDWPEALFWFASLDCNYLRSGFC